MFDFDEIVDRSGTNSIKWDIKEGELPMWVADMDFKTAPPVIDALKKRVDHGILITSLMNICLIRMHLSFQREQYLLFRV